MKQEQETEEAVDLSATDVSGVIVSKELKMAMHAPGFVPNTYEFLKMSSGADDDGGGTIGYREFLKMMAHVIRIRDPKDEDF